MRFTVRGSKHGLPVEVSWDEGVVDGDPEVMDALLNRAHPAAVQSPPVNQAGLVIGGLTEPIPFLRAVKDALDEIEEIDTLDGRAPLQPVTR